MMDVPKPANGDVNIGTGTFTACWILTSFVGLILLSRLMIKAYLSYPTVKVTRHERIWRFEDLSFTVAYACDLGHMSLVQKSYKWGLGRHYYYLNAVERVQSMKFDFISQPLGIAASMFSRTGMMLLLYRALAVNNHQAGKILVACMIIQIIVNLFTIIQILVQCGPNPYHTSNRLTYFHYMWDALPSNGSVVCQSPTVQTTTGFIQGAFNTVIDFGLSYLALFELWQIYFFHGERAVTASFRNLEKTKKARKIWQTISLGGPLVLSGVASIVKTVLLKSIASREDFTYNIVSFVLWVKIENYSILLATFASIYRVFVALFITPFHEHGTTRGLQSGIDTRNIGGERENEFEMPEYSSVHSKEAKMDWRGVTVRTDVEIHVKNNEAKIPQKDNKVF